MNTMPADKYSAAIANLQLRWSDTAPQVMTMPRLEVVRGERVFVGGPSGSG